MSHPASEKSPNDRAASSTFSGRRTTASARSRPRASVACVNCRQKKIKCDAQNLEPGQSCSMCRNSNSECVVNRQGDRRKHGSREHITALQGRMETLEALISQYGVNGHDTTGPQTARITLGSPSTTSSDFALPTATTDQPRSRRASQAEPTNERTPVSLESFHDGEAGELEDPPEIPSLSETTAVVSEPAPNDDGARSVATGGDFNAPMHSLPPDSFPAPPEQRVSTIDDLSPSLDADSSPGKVRYYGPTTQLHIQNRPEGDVNGTANKPSLMADFAIDMDSTQLRDVLIQSCWSYYSRSVRVVDEHLFMAHRACGKRSQYYSKFLEASLLACATRMSTSQAVRKLGRAYANQAKQDLVFELEQPTIATLQAFFLLSDFEATSACDRVGWTYSGIACRLLFDLGLHEDCSQLVKHGILFESDVSLRTTLFLSAFVYDRLWALYLGRPSCIPQVALQQRHPCGVAGDRSTTLDHWVSLCMFMSEVTDMLNGLGSVLDYNSVDRLTELSEKISVAHASLPEGLSPNNISGLDVTAYGLNMQFCGLQIVLHRALVKILCQHAGNNPDANRGSVEKSRGVMYDNAACICRLALAYREIFGIESFITVMLDNMYIAASTLISHILEPPDSNNPGTSYSEALQLIGVISETFEPLQKHYPVVEKMRRTLSSITENTVLAGSFGPVDDGYSQSRSALKPPPKTFIPSLGGSWGSMEALVHDDFILGQNSMLGDGFVPEGGLGDTLWMPDMGLGMIS